MTRRPKVGWSIAFAVVFTMIHDHSSWAAGNRLAARWCTEHFGPGANRGACINQAATGGGPYYTCGPGGTGTGLCGQTCCGSGEVCAESACVTPWVNVGLQDQGVLALVVDPGHETIVYAGTLNDGVFKTTNGGANWVANNTRMTGSFVTALAIDPVSPSTLYAASGPTVFKTTNGGASWAAINTGLPAPLYVDALAVAPSSPSTVHAGTGADGVFVLAPQ